MAWIKSKCGKYEAEFKKLTPADMPEGWDADPKNLPKNTRKLEPSKEERREVLDELAKESQDLGLYEEPKQEVKEEPKEEPKKGRRGRRKKSH